MNLHFVINTESIRTGTLALCLSYSRTVIGLMMLPLKTAYIFAVLSLSFKPLHRGIYTLPETLSDYMHFVICTKYVGTKIMTTSLSIL